MCRAGQCGQSCRSAPDQGATTCTAAAFVPQQGGTSLPGKRRGGIVVEKGLGRLVVVERAVENVQGGIVLVVAGVGEKVGKLQAERVSVVRLATFEFPVEEGKRV